MRQISGKPNRPLAIQDGPFQISSRIDLGFHHQKRQAAKKFGRIVAALMLFAIASFAGNASAKTAPDSATAALTPLGIQITFTACYVSTDENCVAPFSIYRSPQPGFNQPPIGYQVLGNGGNSYRGIFMDQGNLTKGQSYTYRVCAGASAKSDVSNCLTTNTVLLPLPPPCRQ
jgi:hypothetical protein